MYRADWPLITSTPYGYEAFEAGYVAVGDEAYLRIMEGAARFAADRIPVTEVAPGVEASAYTPFDRRQVVNASAYRGFLLTAAGTRFDREDWLAAADGTSRSFCTASAATGRGRTRWTVPTTSSTTSTRASSSRTSPRSGR